MEEQSLDGRSGTVFHSVTLVVVVISSNVLSFIALAEI